MAQILCPKCGSDQITANKKGFSGGKALAGAALTGGVGLLAGTIGSNKVKITCLSCGKEFNPGQGGRPRVSGRNNQPVSSSGTLIGAIIFLVILYFIWHFIF